MDINTKKEEIIKIPPDLKRQIKVKEELLTLKINIEGEIVLLNNQIVQIKKEIESTTATYQRGQIEEKLISKEREKKEQEVAYTENENKLEKINKIIEDYRRL